MSPALTFLFNSFISMRKLLFLSHLLFFITSHCVVNICGEELEKMTFTSPEITDEENRSKSTPTHLKCDSCKAIAFQMNHALNKATRNKMRALTEADVIDALENVCKKDFLEYGMKRVDDKNRLSGPGTEANVVPGMMQMGGIIPERLHDMCSYFIGEIEEMPIYRAYTEERSDLVSFLCFGHGIHNSCSNEKKDEL